MGQLEWAVAGRPIAGEDASGDDWTVLESAGHALVGVVDGLGHGPPAAVAARQAMQVVTDNPREPLEALFGLSHHALTGTRGAAMTLARVGLDDGSLAWLGIGNVGGYLVRVGGTGGVVAQAAMLRGGILGYRLPAALRVRETSMLPGDLLLLGTDGLVAGFEQAADLGAPTAHLVRDILEHCATGADDALILAVRNRGPSR